MQILDNLVKAIRSKGKLTQWTNNINVIDWFKKLQNKNRLKFIQFDIVAFYPSITPTLLAKSLSWAATITELIPGQKRSFFKLEKASFT